MMDRRKFIKLTGGALTGALLLSCRKVVKDNEETDGINSTDSARADSFEDAAASKSEYFSLMQISSATDTIGNSYILVTGNGKVIVMDGGIPTDESRLRNKIREAGNHVDAWFVSHPHGDHVGAFITILENRKGITIDTIYHSRLSSTLLSQEANARNLYALPFYNALERQTDTKVVDIQRTGIVYDIDGVKIKVLGIANKDILTNAYNNSSMILKVTDASKSVLFLGDAGVECGEKLLAAFPDELDCDYIQMAHHGQQGCDQTFYNTVNFKACLWPTPSWLWNAGENSNYKTWETRKWIAAKGITENHVSSLEFDWKLV